MGGRVRDALLPRSRPIRSHLGVVVGGPAPTSPASRMPPPCLCLPRGCYDVMDGGIVAAGCSRERILCGFASKHFLENRMLFASMYSLSTVLTSRRACTKRFSWSTMRSATGFWPPRPFPGVVSKLHYVQFCSVIVVLLFLLVLLCFV